MDDSNLSEQEANDINEQMAKHIEERRRARPERRRGAAAPTVERRRVCSYCFQYGDHPTAAHCMRALERA